MNVTVIYVCVCGCVFYSLWGTVGVGRKWGQRGGGELRRNKYVVARVCVLVYVLCVLIVRCRGASIGHDRTPPRLGGVPSTVQGRSIVY